MRRLEQPHGVQRQRQLVEVLNQPLHAGVDQVLGRAIGRVGPVDQSGDVFQQPALAGPLKGRAHRIAGPLHLDNSVQEFQEHVLLARDDHIGAFAAVGRKPEEVPRLVNGLGAAGQDQRPVIAQLPRVADQPAGRRAVDLHGGDHEDLRRLAVETCRAGPDIGVPLLQHQANVLEARGIQRGAHRPRGAGNERLVDKHERPQPRPRIEGVDEEDRGVASLNATPNLGLQLAIAAGRRESIRWRTCRKFHRDFLSYLEST